MSKEESENRFRHELQTMEAAAINFAYRFVKDAKVRQQYINKTQELSRELKAAVAAGTKSPLEAAKAASEMRNEIMEMARLKSSDIGLAKARKLKAKGIAFDDLVKKYSQTKYGKAFKDLTKGQQDEVLMEIVTAAGRANPKVSAGARRLGGAGRALWVLSIAIAAYNIGTAEDKVDAAGREAASAGGGFAGGAAGGALAGIWFGPIGVAVGVAIGGTIGAIMSDSAYVQIRGQSNPTVDSIISRYTNVVSTDETGIANTLYNEVGIDMLMVSKVFGALSRDYSTDVDDVAQIYIERVRSKVGPIQLALKRDTKLKNQLVAIFESGWTSSAENAQIRYLRAL